MTQTTNNDTEARTEAGGVQYFPALPPDTTLAEQVQARLREKLGAGAADTERLGNVPMAEWRLVDEGRCSEEDILRAYSEVTGLRVADEEELQNLDVYPDVTYDYLAHWNAVPVSWGADTVTIAVGTPYQLGLLAQQWLGTLKRQPRFVLGRRTMIERVLSLHYDTSLSETEDTQVTGEESEEALRGLAHEAPIVRLVNDTFKQALEMGASDIHIEPGESNFNIRFRIDGVLHTMQTSPLTQYPAIASRLKLLAGMNIAERRLPQDGRIDLNMASHNLDVRVSTVPTMYGESIVLRLLQKDASLFDLKHLGLDDDTRAKFEPTIKNPYGMILVVGPTGSGKTTTLYCVLDMLNEASTKIVTVEDPIEYQLPGVTQIQVRPQIGLTFAQGLRHIVRQDPDVILVGEVRDRETAEIAIHAALTGHLVLTTLHTNDAAGAISRLQEMGMENFLLSSALLGVLSQRLVRRVCMQCNGEGVQQTRDASTGETRKCKNCAGTGYRGRIGIFEWLQVDEDIRKAINEQRDANTISSIAKANGMKSLQKDGEEKVRAQITTEAEVARVCQLDVEE